MASVSARQRIGWLLRTNRRFGEEEIWRSGREFARRFRGSRGHQLSPSHVTRWERGDLSVSAEVVGRYEVLLGAPDQSLVGVCDAVLRFAAAGPGAPVLDRSGPAAALTERRLHQLLDLAEGPEPLSHRMWSELTVGVAASPGLVLHPPKLWYRMAQRLLTELVRAEDVAWLVRQESLSRLLEHPAAGRHVVDACIALSEDAGVPAYLEPISLLDVTANATANRYVLHQLQHPRNERMLQGALMASIRKVRHGHFRTDAEWAGLVGAVVDVLTGTDPHPAVLPLAIEVGRGLARRVPGAASLYRCLPATRVAQRIWSGGRTGDPDVIGVICGRLAAGAQARLPGEPSGTDPVLPRLIEEMLFSASVDERLYTSMLVAATPYRMPLAEAIMSEVDSGLLHQDEALARAVLRALTTLNVTSHRQLVQRMLTNPRLGQPAAYAAAWATPHCRGRLDEAVWRRILAVQVARWQRLPSQLGEGILEGIAYGIGTEGQPGILRDIRDDPQLPPRVRATAGWWLANLPAPA